jgi:CheY-like chemotaxis protein
MVVDLEAERRRGAMTPRVAERAPEPSSLEGIFTRRRATPLGTSRASLVHAMPKTRPASWSGPRASRARILVVDDEPLIGRSLRRSLSDADEVVAVTSAAAALARLRRGERYDVVLCDLMMPGMDGIELHRQLCAVLPEEASRIVFITGGAVTARVEAFFRRVPNVLLEKPIDFEGLRALIERRMGTVAREAAPPKSA